VIASCVMTSVAVSACGGDGGAAQERQEKEQRADKALERADDARAIHAACSGQPGALVALLGDLDSRLRVTFPDDEYTLQIGDLRAAYDKIDFDELGAPGTRCLRQVGVPAEKALDLYAEAATGWVACVEDVTCDRDAIEPALQRRWSQAADFVESAQDGLDRLDDEAGELEQEATDLAVGTSREQFGAVGLIEDFASVLERTLSEDAVESVDRVTVEDTGRLGVYLRFGEDAEGQKDAICHAVAKVPTDPDAAIYQYRDHGRTTYLAATC
jgi:hypothetical protein